MQPVEHHPLKPSPTTTSCLNCDSPLQESYRYCPNCSQKKNLHRISFHDLVHEAVHYVTHADKGFLYLLKALALRTGEVAREYVDGKRKKYFPPLNFYLIVAALMVFMMTTLAKKTSRDVLAENPSINRITDPAEKQRVVRIYERRAEAMHFTSRYSNILAFLAVPLIAFIYWFFYRKARFNYVEHLIAGMYMNGFTNLFYILVFTPLVRLLVKGNANFYLIGFFLIQIIYCGVFYYRFINRPGKPALAKAMGISLLTIVFWAALTAFSISTYISTGFWGLAA